jgi:hypothetical protein
MNITCHEVLFLSSTLCLFCVHQVWLSGYSASYWDEVLFLSSTLFLFCVHHLWLSGFSVSYWDVPGSNLGPENGFSHLASNTKLLATL